MKPLTNSYLILLTLSSLSSMLPPKASPAAPITHLTSAFPKSTQEGRGLFPSKPNDGSASPFPFPARLLGNHYSSWAGALPLPPVKLISTRSGWNEALCHLCNALVPAPVDLSWTPAGSGRTLPKGWDAKGSTLETPSPPCACLHPKHSCSCRKSS